MRLKTLAERIGWGFLHPPGGDRHPASEPTGKPDGESLARRAVHAVRTAAALAVIPLGVLPGLGVWLATRDRRRAIDRTIETWGIWGTWAAGIALEVTGAEHLRRERPAVFLLNHQSGVDPILACALLRGGFTAVAKREIRRNPVLGPAFALAGVAFVDRGGGSRAIADLEPAVQALRGGLSIAMAPEGTRSRSGALAPFKKGAFRLAMAAGVPLVPIVIHDARKVLPRAGRLMRAGRVRVDVLPPVPTASWTHDRLDDEIAAVRRLYLERLDPTP
jgi:putative phosphoserine phosphatase/1-acylglycerol-3-phosphate O-acyltransferase